MKIELVVIFLSLMVILFVKYLIIVVKGDKCISMITFKPRTFSTKFKSKYDKVKKECKEEVESSRKVVLLITILRVMLATFAITFIILVIFVYGSKISMDNRLILLSTSVLFIIGMLYCLSKEMNYTVRYIDKYKRLFVKNLINSFGNKLQYDATGTVPRDTYEKSGFEDKKVDNYFGSDYIFGPIVGRRQLNLSQVYVKNQKGNVFSGIFAYATIDEEANFQIMLKQNELKNTKLFQINTSTRAFDKFYSVYSGNSEFTLDKKIIDILIEYRRKYDLDVEMIIKKGKVYIRIYSGNIIKPRIFKVWENQSRVWACYLIIVMLMRIIKCLSGTQNVEK